MSTARTLVTHVLVIGAGGARLPAAIAVREQGVDVLVTAKRARADYPHEIEDQRTHIRVERLGDAVRTSRAPVPDVPGELRPVGREELALEGRLLE